MISVVHPASVHLLENPRCPFVSGGRFAGINYIVLGKEERPENDRGLIVCPNVSLFKNASERYGLMLDLFEFGERAASVKKPLVAG